MRCEHCTRKIGRSEIATGIRFGTIENSELFIPDQESAPTIICSACGEIILKMIYQKLSNPFKQIQQHYL